MVLGDRGRGPDLANVREMAFGVWNGGVQPITGEVWVDELRLAGGVTDAGLAAHVNFGLSAADVMDTRVTVSDRGAFFRQLTESLRERDHVSPREAATRDPPASHGAPATMTPRTPSSAARRERR